MPSTTSTRGTRSGKRRSGGKEDEEPNEESKRARTDGKKKKKGGKKALGDGGEVPDESMEEKLQEYEKALKAQEKEMKEQKAQMEECITKYENLVHETSQKTRHIEAQGGRRWARRTLMSSLPGVHEQVVKYAKWFLKKDKFPPEGYHIYSETPNTVCNGIMRKVLADKPQGWTKREYWVVVLDAWKYQLQMRRNIGLQRQKALEVGELAQVGGVDLLCFF